MPTLSTYSLVKVFIWSVLFGFLFSSQSWGQTHPTLQAELVEMMQSDQEGRKALGELTKQHGHESEEVQALWEKQSTIDRKNMARLEEIIAEHGWPGRRLVGNHGAVAAFLILQHAAPEQQRQYVELVRAAVAADDLHGQYLALLEDRILIHDGKKQIYGTQVQTAEDGGYRLAPIEDEKNVDARRKAVGLEPLAEYLKKSFGIEYTVPSEEVPSEEVPSEEVPSEEVSGEEVPSEEVTDEKVSGEWSTDIRSRSVEPEDDADLVRRS